MTTFVDTNIIVSLIKPEEEAHEWAKRAVEERKQHGPLVICDIVYSEFSVTMADVKEVNEIVHELALERLRFSDEVLFRAGQAFHAYKKRGGPKTNVLADYLIAAQAEVEGAPLLTNNAKDYRTPFPNVTIIEPPPRQASA